VVRTPLYYLSVIALADIIGVVLRFCGLSLEVALLVVGLPLFLFFLRAEELVPRRLLKGTRRAALTVRGSSEDGVTHKRTFEGVPLHIDTLFPTRLSWSGALSTEDNTGNNISELESDVRVIPLSQLFDPAILELHLPWAGPALHLVKAANEVPDAAAIYIGAVDTREDVRSQLGVLQLFLIAPNGTQAHLRLRALRPSGIFEGGHLNNDWLQYTLKVLVKDDDDFR
jgi:hypothetical protein